MAARIASLISFSALLALACSSNSGSNSPFSTGSTLTNGTLGETGGDSDSSDGDPGDGDGDPGDGDGDGDGTIFDVGDGGDGDGDGDPGACTLPHTPCDHDSSDPFNAIGLNCPGELQITPSVDAHPDGMAIRTSFGGTTAYDPREGSSYFVLSTGHVAELEDEPTNPGDQIYHCNKWFSPGDGMDTTSFPAPIEAQDVGGDCLANPGLVGTGDCSNTIESQFQQSGWKYDYQEIRLSVTVPADAHALAFDVAYFTTEWPVFAGQNYNDMFKTEPPAAREGPLRGRPCGPSIFRPPVHRLARGFELDRQHLIRRCRSRALAQCRVLRPSRSERRPARVRGHLHALRCWHAVADLDRASRAR
jgi:hypothetical protein